MYTKPSHQGSLHRLLGAKGKSTIPTKKKKPGKPSYSQAFNKLMGNSRA